MRVAGQASKTNKFAILWADDHKNSVFLDLTGYLRIRCRVITRSFGELVASIKMSRYCARNDVCNNFCLKPVKQ
jgi:hypothetical protein